MTGITVSQRLCLERMGMDPWLVSRLRPRPAGGQVRATRTAPAADVPARKSPAPAASTQVVAGVDITPAKPTTTTVTQALADVAVKVAACQQCALSKTRKQAVFARGAENAACMVIGEAPGAEEDRLGEPFVGRAGQLLDAMLAAIGLPRNSAYIANVIKCRPPSNRNPQAEEVTACSSYLARQIELVAPRLLLAVGRIAAHALLETDAPLSALRGRLHKHPASGLPLLVSYHPAYLLRSPARKADAWSDLLRVRDFLRSADATRVTTA